MTSSSTGIRSEKLRDRSGRTGFPDRIASAGLRAFIWLRVSDRMVYAAVLIAYLLVVLTGMTTSSLGIGSLRQNPAEPLGLQFGTPRWIRSDEYNVVSPIAMSILATTDQPTLSPLGAAANLFNRYPGGFFQSLVFFDSSLLRLGGIFPQQMLFAARWWLPVLLVLLFLPRWISQVGGSKRLGWFAAGLVVVAPATAWWSMAPVQCLAYVVAGCSLMLSAHKALSRGKRVWSVVQILVAGVLLAGLPSFYIPWAFVLGAPFLIGSVFMLLNHRTRLKSGFLVLGLTGFVALFFAAGMIWESLDGLKSMIGTVYPGSRRSGPEALPLGQFFGAPMLTPLVGADPASSNASELSTAFNITLVWVAVLLAAVRLRARWSGRFVLIVFLSWGALWSVWCLVSLGPAGTNFPILNYVPASRAGQVIGYLGIVILALLLSGVREVKLRTALVAAAVCGLITGYSGSMLKANELPTMPLWGLLLASLAVALVVFAVSYYRNKIWVLGLAVLIAAVPAVKVNPIIFGLGDFRDSATAQFFGKISSEAREQGQFWASDTGSVDALMLASGVPTLSGLQRSGPDNAMWSKLDPENKFKDAWNRGGGYIDFEWRVGSATDISTNGFDVTFVKIDPCQLVKDMPQVSNIVSASPLTASCLSPVSTVEWSGAPMSVYRVMR
ncbi:MAG: hypothetical protein L0G87_05220 [Renibacterium salmoninarum]|nr:hypothetical protein [Renibacterium salmoninarum]